MELLTLFAIIAGIIIIGYFAELLFKKTHIPDVLILIAIGIGIRYFFPAINPLEFGMSATLFTTFALIYLLFQGALAIDFDSLFKSVKSASLLTVFIYLHYNNCGSVIDYFLWFLYTFSLTLWNDSWRNIKCSSHTFS
jgi:NhaP-type Na+/H+ or K+/H+ antiporter